MTVKIQIDKKTERILRDSVCQTCGQILPDVEAWKLHVAVTGHD